VTPELAAKLAEPFCHPAAAALVLEAATAPGWERRERSRRALAILNPDRPLVDGLGVGEPCAPWAEAVGLAAVEVVLYVARGLDRAERARAAGLIVALCREASRLRERRESEAA